MCISRLIAPFILDQIVLRCVGYNYLLFFFILEIFRFYVECLNDWVKKHQNVHTTISFYHSTGYHHITHAQGRVRVAKARIGVTTLVTARKMREKEKRHNGPYYDGDRGTTVTK